MPSMEARQYRAVIITAILFSCIMSGASLFDSYVATDVTDWTVIRKSVQSTLAKISVLILLSGLLGWNICPSA